MCAFDRQCHYGQALRRSAIRTADMCPKLHPFFGVMTCLVLSVGARPLQSKENGNEKGSGWPVH